MRPVHPGEVLREDFLTPLGIDAAGFAQRIGVPAEKVTAVLTEKSPMDLVLAEAIVSSFGGDAASWLVLQQKFEETRHG